MKKTFITIIALLTIVGLIAPVQAAAIDHGKRVTMLMKEYSSNADFQLINLGRFGLYVVKAAMRQSGDKDAHFWI